MPNRMRNIPWRILGYGCLTVVALIGVGMLMGVVNKKADAQVCTSMRVMVEGKEAFIDQHDISDLVKGKFGQVVGKPLRYIPVQKIEQALLELPYVSAAEIYVDMDGVLQIAVQQREVVLRIVNKNGNEYYIDTKGAKVPVTLRYVPHVLVANGNIKESYRKALDTVETALVKDLLRIVAHVKGDPLWSNQIVQLYVNDFGDIEIVPRVGNQQLVLGNAVKLEEKLDRLVVFYKNILPRVGSDAYEKVNVKYDGQIICERKEGWMLDSLQTKMKMN
ncbi:cell division protein FtsQ/DivIB [Sphingobacterium griseoflavum]|uniref:Cell division protein FtsQ n=1 Tax=Sphingobacterium griseoflavum TaxID=1474952 RepID=A0ABQ3HQH1_9SPHI|nr:cell division protein FtsQ [Sphingobacterium griseoflavum]GHE23508.1 cell division protein FtsQ [Sphingobacterium griseoflavum]